MAERVVWSWYVSGSRRRDELKATEEPKRDDYLEKLVKLFPVEVATAFTAADAFARTTTGGLRLILLWFVAAVGLIGVPLAFARLRKLDITKGPGLVQVIIGVVAYVIWVYAQGVLSAEIGLYQAAIAGIAAVVFLFFVFLFSPTPPEPQKP